jgi:ATP/maltotriose-dependent transcriptional regulator MalT/DNA-binding SARP family transcriptional activator
MEKLRNNLDRRMILVCAGPGYGKSTLLSQLMHSERLPAVFYSLDRHDGERQAFIEHLLTALVLRESRSATPRHYAELVRLLDFVRLGRSVPNSLFAATVLNHLSSLSSELFLIFDDYHRLPEKSPVHRLVSSLAERLPARSHLVIASRVAPPIPGLAEFKAKGEVFELEQNDLKVTTEEIAQLSPSEDGSLLPAEAHPRLLEMTEGWITGIHLALQSIAGHGADLAEMERRLAGEGTLFDYFASDILESLPRQCQVLLVRCSVLDHLDPEACRAVSGLPQAGRLLEKISRHNLFVAKAGRGYFCHSLFRRFLQNRIEGDHERRRLHEAAAAWLESHGETVSSVDHLLEAGCHAQAARAMEPVVETVYNSARFQLVERWLSALPAALVEASPALLIGRSSLYCYKGDFEQGRIDLDKALRLAKTKGDRLYQARVLVQLGTMAYNHGRLTEALRLARSAQRLGLKTGQRVRVGSDVIVCLCHLQSGRYSAAERATRTIPREIQQLYGASIPIRDNFRCVVLTRSGRYAEAMDVYKRIMPGIEPEALFHPNACMFLMDAITAARHHGSFELARRWFDIMGRASAASEATALLERMTFIEISVQDGDLSAAADSARKLLAEPDILSRWGYPGQIPYLRFRLAELDYYQGNYGAALQGLEQCRSQNIEVYEKQGQLFREAMLASATRRRSQARSLCRHLEQLPACPRRGLQLALVRAASSDDRQALRHLAQAISLSGRYGMDGELALEVRYHPKLRRVFSKVKTTPKILARLGMLISVKPAAEKADSPRISLLGQLAINWPGSKKISLSWQGYKEASLLGFLLLHRGRCFNREDLSRQVWPGAKPASAFNRLFVAVSRLNAALPGLVVRSASGYSLAEGEGLTLDVEVFEQCHRQAMSSSASNEQRLQAVRRGLAVYRGPLLQNVGDAWAEPFRRSYQLKHLQLLRAAVEAESSQGNWAAAVEAARLLVEIDPGDETSITALLTGLGAMGLRSDMATFFAKYTRRLRARGRAPGKAVLREYQRLQDL